MFAQRGFVQHPTIHSPISCVGQGVAVVCFKNMAHVTAVVFLNLIPESFISDLFVRVVHIFSRGPWLVRAPVILSFKMVRGEYN